MSSPPPGPRPAGPRDLLYFRTPGLWPTWPFLPVIRRRPGGAVECGLLYDFRGTSGRCGYSATVIHGNLFLVPATEEGLLALPREVYDTADELAAAGWVVD